MVGVLEVESAGMSKDSHQVSCLITDFVRLRFHPAENTPSIAVVLALSR